MFRCLVCRSLWCTLLSSILFFQYFQDLNCRICAFIGTHTSKVQHALPWAVLLCGSAGAFLTFHFNGLNLYATTSGKCLASQVKYWKVYIFRDINILSSCIASFGLALWHITGMHIVRNKIHIYIRKVERSTYEA